MNKSKPAVVTFSPDDLSHVLAAEAARRVGISGKIGFDGVISAAEFTGVTVYVSGDMTGEEVGEWVRENKGLD